MFLYHSINKPRTTHRSPIRSDEELALEKSAFNFFFYGCELPFANTADILSAHLFELPTDDFGDFTSPRIRFGFLFLSL